MRQVLRVISSAIEKDFVMHTYYKDITSLKPSVVSDGLRCNICWRVLPTALQQHLSHVHSGVCADIHAG